MFNRLFPSQVIWYNKVILHSCRFFCMRINLFTSPQMVFKTQVVDRRDQGTGNCGDVTVTLVNLSILKAEERRQQTLCDKCDNTCNFI